MIYYFGSVFVFRKKVDSFPLFKRYSFAERILFLQSFTFEHTWAACEQGLRQELGHKKWIRIFKKISSPLGSMNTCNI